MFFKDFSFPLEFYEKTGDFSTEIQELLEFAPIFLNESLKNEPIESKEPLNQDINSTQTAAAAGSGTITATKRTNRATHRYKSNTEIEFERQSKAVWRETLPYIFDGIIRPIFRYGLENRKEEQTVYITNSITPTKETYFIHECRSCESSKQEDKKCECCRNKKEGKHLITNNNEDGNLKPEIDEKNDTIVKKSDGQDALMVGAIAISALSVSLYSTFKYSQKNGEIDFLSNFQKIICSVEEIIKTTKIWIKEREELELGVPSLLYEDLRKVELLTKSLKRLDKTPEKELDRISYGSMALFSAVTFVSTAYKCANLLRYIGLAGIVTSIAGFVYQRGSYSSSKYLESDDILVKRVSYACKVLKADSARREHLILNWNYDL
jgi:hypothetical protein